MSSRRADVLPRLVLAAGLLAAALGAPPAMAQTNADPDAPAAEARRLQEQEAQRLRYNMDAQREQRVRQLERRSDQLEARERQVRDRLDLERERLQRKMQSR